MCWRKPLDANTGEILKFLKYFSGPWGQMGQSPWTEWNRQMQLLDLIRFLQKKNFNCSGLFIYTLAIQIINIHMEKSWPLHEIFGSLQTKLPLICSDCFWGTDIKSKASPATFASLLYYCDQCLQSGFRFRSMKCFCFPSSQHIWHAAVNKIL